MPEDLGEATEQPALEAPSLETPWLEPLPASWLGPELQLEQRETVRLAFVAALQRLAPRQRAAVLLCEVLGWSASETAALLELSVAAVNSALQRGRQTLGRKVEGRQHVLDEALLEKYLHSWEAHDLEAFVSLLKDDAVFSMPPWAQWYRGRAAMHAFFAEAWKGCHGLRLTRTSANGGPAFCVFERDAQGQWQPHSVHLLELEHGQLATLTTFVPPLGPALVKRLLDVPGPQVS